MNEIIESLGVVTENISKADELSETQRLTFLLRISELKDEVIDLKTKNAYGGGL